MLKKVYPTKTAFCRGYNDFDELSSVSAVHDGQNNEENMTHGQKNEENMAHGQNNKEDMAQGFNGNVNESDNIIIISSDNQSINR